MELEKTESLPLEEIEKNQTTRIEAVNKWTYRLIWAGILVFLLILPFHLVIKRLLPGPLGTYWKEVLLGVLVVGWAVNRLVKRKLPIAKTPLNIAILLYVCLLLLRFIIDRSGLVSAWGLYISVMYLPLVWLVPAILQGQPTRVRWIIGLMVGVGGLVALGGVVEFILDIPLWPSEETVTRQGFADVFVYGTYLRRVYFVFDSPTTLANTLAMLLPLAIALGLSSNSSKVRIFAAINALLIAACIIVTFSRGIWVASLLSLIFVTAFGLYAFRHELPQLRLPRRGYIILLPVVLIFGALYWILTALPLSTKSALSSPSTVELSREAYQSVPIIAEQANFLETDPDYGEATIQEWTIFDPFQQNDDIRRVIYEHPPEQDKAEIIYRLEVPESGALQFAIALSPEVWSPEKGDGVGFQIYAVSSDAPDEGQFVFNRYINPKHNPSDRRWRNFMVDLSPWAGRTVNLSLITICGAAGDCSFDWAGWADFKLVAVQPWFFDENTPKENAVLAHFRSIFDWQGDETNRDRLAAWNTGLSAWRSSPIWGTGLGTTGVAALRTQPDKAFVTESQVLKSLTELGLPGLAIFAYLWFVIGRTALTAFMSVQNRTHRLLILGILGSLLVVFIEGWVYQNLEVKQVNASYWILVGILAYMSGEEDAKTVGVGHHNQLEP